MSEKKLVIIGTGGLAQDITDHFLSTGIKNIGYVGRMTTKLSVRIKKDYLGAVEDFEFNPKQHQVFIALGENPGRNEVYELLRRQQIKPMTFIHPSATVLCSASLATGVYVGPYCVVGANASIGENTFLNKFVNIGHDAQLGKSVTVYPYGCIGGSAKIGDNVLISTRSTVYPSTQIGCDCIIASNTEVRNNVADRTFIMSKTQQLKKSL